VYQEEKKRKRHTVLNTIQKRKVPCLKHTWIAKLNGDIDFINYKG
jgi:hypothetical protein